MSRHTRFFAAIETCENLLSPGKKWRLSPYVRAALQGSSLQAWATFVPVYQAVILDLLQAGRLPARLSMLELGEPAGLGSLAILDALLAWETTCTLYEIPSGLEQVQLHLPHSQSEPACLAHFRHTIETRASELPEFTALTRAARWVDTGITQTDGAPNLVLCPFPWDRHDQLNRLLDNLPPGAILVGLEWPQSNVEPMLLQWRYELLQHRSDLVALGPCGAEYVRRLPDSCRTCHHGRREAMHCPDGIGEATTPVWTYTLLIKQAIPVDVPPEPLISDDILAQVEVEHVHLRYVGTIREQTPLADHPDTADDDPNNETWREYLKVCPGHSPANRVAIERRAGMQMPRLRYGQWLHLRQLRPQQPYANHPDVYTIKVRDETAFYPEAGPPVAKTFIKQYPAAVRAAVDEAGYRLFGFPTMRDFQHTILGRVLTGGDILAIAATGGGKSECFILPAVLLPGITIVVSPLKSLILDQYEQRLRDRYGLDHLTTFINGDVPFYERQGRLRRLALGYFKLIYMTPEQLERSYVLDALRQADQRVGVRYLAMDEAHCISQWGHDFRPSYLNIVQRLQAYNLSPCRIALTATASPLVRDDVCDELRLNKTSLSQGGDVFIDSSNRPELNLVVQRVNRTEEKARIITDALRRLNGQGSAIVFMPHTGGPIDQPRDFGAPVTAIRPENVGMVSSGVTPFAHYLQQQLHQPVAIYHGALDDEVAHPDSSADDEEDTIALEVRTRQHEQRSFITDQKRIMIATKGFGMGIDKPEIRLVIHRSPPANLEAYAQEAGRAGRDQKLATVILLFSDDQPQIAPVSSDTYLKRTSLDADRDIQQYFIDQKYVRRQDVQAMLAFLGSDQPQRVNRALYFTSDQVMAAFDQYMIHPHLAGLNGPYAWPPFAPRQRTGRWESSEHKQILDMGYWYRQKQAHIGRILAVLFNNRPTIEGQIVPAVHTAHEIGALLHQFRLYRPEGIVASTAYFGEYLRQAGISADELGRLLPNGDRTDLIPLALRLGRSLRETVSMLKDIRYCEGRTDQFGHWVGTMLNFWWVEAPRRVKIPDAYTNLAVWRRYAGANRRVKPPPGRTSLDDFFPWKVVNKPLGWEVTPGPGLGHPDLTAYLDAFMTLHDERQRNDQDNFAYLLNRYIGNGDGPGECLRSLLLGYLKTNEVVLGGNCYGCSHCVPQLDFERYPLARRQEVIARLLPETVTLIDQLEAHSRQRPSLSLQEQLLAAIAQEDAAGRSGTAYLDSWLARLIQDDPEHQGALWLRLYAFGQGRLRLSPQDLLAAIERLVRLTRSKPELATLQRIINIWQNDPAHEEIQLPLAVQAAELAHRTEDWAAEVDEWQKILATVRSAGPKASEFSLKRQALSRLLELYRPDGHHPDQQQASQVGLALAHLPDVTFRTAREAYNVVTPTWNWLQLQAELSAAQTPQPAAALISWLDNRAASSDFQPALAWLEENSERWDDWPVEALQILGQALDADLDQAPKLLLALADCFIKNLVEPARATRYLLRAWAGGIELTQGRLKWIGEYFTKLDAAWCKALFASRLDATAGLVSELQHIYGQEDFPAAWFAYLPVEVIERLPDDALVPLLETAVSQDKRLNPTLLSLVVKRLNRSDSQDWLSTMAELARRHSHLSIPLLQECLAQKKLRREPLQALFPILLNHQSNPAAVKGVLNALTFRLEVSQEQDLLGLAVDNWRTLLISREEIPSLMTYRIEGVTLLNFASKWLAYRDKPHRLDMLVIMLRDVRRRSTNTWLTPVSLEFQALCVAGRFAEAEQIMARYTDLRISGQSAQSHLKSARSQTSERQVQFEAEFRRLWELASQNL